MPVDYKKYPKDWFIFIRPSILLRAKNKCEFCGLNNYIWGYREKSGLFVECDSFMLDWAARNNIRVFQIVLSVVHLDHDITNNDFNNLRLLCQKCHNNLDLVNRLKNRRLKKKIKYLKRVKDLDKMLISINKKI